MNTTIESEQKIEPTSFRSFNDRHRKALSPQQIAYLTARIQGKSKEESKRIARYSPTTSTCLIERNPNMRDALLVCMQANGITEQFLAEKLMQGMNAKKKHFFTKDGIVTDHRRVNDNETQQKYFRAALEIRGDIKINAIETLNLGLINIPEKMDDNQWNTDTLDVKQELPTIESDNKNEGK